MDCDRETEALVALTTVPGLGAIKIRLLVNALGSAEQALACDPATLKSLPGFNARLIDALAACQRRPSQHLRRVAEQGAQVIAYTHPSYPKRLLEIADAPVVLYISGELTPADSRSIAVVGTRGASIYGREMAHRFGRDLAALGFTVISGLARGIDTEAHRGALETGRTLAVIGSGLADIYPEENRKLAAAIAQRGALISEFPMDTPPDRQNFPQRNRIVAAMALGTLLIEAPTKSGAMITMEKGLAQGRKLFALPGRVDMDSFRGNHLLLKTGRAQLVESASDIAASFDQLFALTPRCEIQPDRPPLEGEEHKLLALMSAEELTIDELGQRSRLPSNKLSVLLMSLVLKKRVKEYPGKIFKKC